MERSANRNDAWRGVAVLGSLPALAAGTAAAGGRPATSLFVLDNGLKVVLLEKRGLPLVNISAAVGVGTKDEPAGSSGLVHLLEHCILFRGTEFRSGTEIGRDIRRNGAYFNAHTGQDLASFEISLPRTGPISAWPTRGRSCSTSRSPPKSSRRRRRSSWRRSG